MPEQFGQLGSSFFLLFSISAIIVGFIVNRVATRWVLLAMAVIWSLAQFPMVGTVSFTTLLICRIILGAGEGPAFSVAAHAIYKWFPGREAHAADRDPVAGLGLRRDPRGAGAELGDRQLFLAPRFRRARRRRPDVGRGVARAGQGRPAGVRPWRDRRRAAHSLFPVADLAHLHRLRRRHVRRLLGAVARPDLVHALHRAGARLFAKGCRPGSRCCPGCSAPPSCC